MPLSPRRDGVKETVISSVKHAVTKVFDEDPGWKQPSLQARTITGLPGELGIAVKVREMEHTKERFFKVKVTEVK